MVRARGMHAHMGRHHPGVVTVLKEPEATGAPSTNGKDGEAAQSEGQAEESQAPRPRERKRAGAFQTGELDFGSYLSVVPKAFTTTSALLWQAKKVCEEFWEWPVMEPGEWLDTYILVTMRKMGVGLATAVFLRPEALGNGETPPEEDDDGAAS